MLTSEKHKSELFKQSNINCVRLVGNSYKIGFQHGTLLTESAKAGVQKFISEYIPNLIKRVVRPEPAAFVFLKYLKTKTQKFINRIPKELKDEIRGFCDATGLNYEQVLENFVFPEISTYLISKYAGEDFIEKTHLSGAILGCTSIVTKGFATDTGELFHARNFDFSAVDYWDKYPTIFYVYPEDAFNYISVASAGMLGVVSGINEKQISFALHENYTNVSNENNLPVFALGSLILKYADSLEKAQEIINSSKATSGWSITISDNKTKKAFVAEIYGDEIKYRFMSNDTLICTNSYISKEFHQYETTLNPLFNLSSITRYQRANKLVEDNLGKINLEFLVKTLGDRYDPTSEKERIFGYTISQNHTVSSVIFAPEQNCLFMAEGKTPVSNSKYLKFYFDFEKNKVEELYAINGNKFTDEKNEQAMNIILEAHNYYKNKEYEKAFKTIVKASKLTDYNEPVIDFICGLIHIKKGEFLEAADFLGKAYEHENDIYRAGMIKIWLGRVYDLLQKREKAQKHYRYVEQMNKEAYSYLIALAKKGLKKIYKKSQIKKFDIDIWLGEEIRTL
jgi:tetratricopeptide (TPR) repeat protein